MEAYKEILRKILKDGVRKPNRTGVDTISITGYQFEHNMNDGFPLLTTKKMGVKSIFAELEFFIKGLSDKKWLQDRGCHIWDEWANPEKVNETYIDTIHMSDLANITDKDIVIKSLQKTEMDLGRIYGVQWRDWKTNKFIIKDGMLTDDFESLDQLKDVIERAKKNPLDRRLLVTAWRPDEIHQMALPPCHHTWQLLSDGTNLDLIWMQRSVDVGLGLPYNIASYAMLLLLLAKELGLKPNKLVGQLADTHIYINHINKLKEQLSRTPYDLPTIEIPDESWTNIFEWEYTNYVLKNYQHHNKIKMDVAI